LRLTNSALMSTAVNCLRGHVLGLGENQR
jgi:hypothetical protein